MGFPLYQRPGAVGGPLLDDAQPVHEPKGLLPLQCPVLGDAQLVYEPTGLPLHEHQNGSVINLLLDDAQPVHEPNGSSDLLSDDVQLMRELSDLPLHQGPNRSAGESLRDDTQLVYKPNGSLLHQGPNESVRDRLPDDAQLAHEPKGSSLHRGPNKSVSDSFQDNMHEPDERDPHVVPSFTSEGLIKPRSTILYLPPFMSSLPQDIPVPPVSVDRPPLITETRLPNIDPVSLSLHKALHHFGPLSEDYAGVPYADAFNWSDLELPEDEEREWYAVAFRSRRKKGSDSSPLYDADRRAHEEAVSNGGLIMYWYGVPNPVTGMNLATCIWQSRKHAIAANSRPHHIQAMKHAAAAYEIYGLERYRLTKLKGEKGILVEEFSGGDCGW